MNPFNRLLPISTFFNSKKNNWGINSNEYQFYLSRSSWSILAISILRKLYNNQDKVIIFMPDYYCNDPLPILENEFNELVYYEINKSFQPKWSSLRALAEKKSPDLIIGVHYFGQPKISNELKSFCVKYKSWLIEDATHCLKKDKIIGNQGDFTLFSPYKHLPIPDGAILYVNNNGPSKLNLDFFKKIKINEILRPEISNLKSNVEISNFFYSNQFNWFLKQLILFLFKNSSFLKSYFKKKYIEALNPTPSNKLCSFKVSRISIFLLKRFDLDLIAKKKLRNQILFTQFLGKTQNYQEEYLLDIDYNFHAPYMLPIYLKSKKKAIDLISNGIPIIKWPLLPKVQINSKNIIENFGNLYFILLNYPLSGKKLIAKLKTQNIPKKIKFEKVHFFDKKVNLNDKINFVQSRNYGISKASVEKKNIEFYNVLLNGKHAGSFQLLIEKKFFFLNILRLNRGPILKLNLSLEDKFYIFSKLMLLGNVLKGTIFSFSPEISFFSLGSIFLKNNRSFRLPFPNWKSMKIDLLIGEEILLKSLKPKWRNALKFSQKSNITLKISKKLSAINRLLEKHFNHTQKNAFKGINPEILRKMFEFETSEECLYVLEAIKDKEIIASILISKYGNNSIYLIGWSNEKGRNYKASYLLIWEAVILSKKLECQIFDLGGLIGKNHPIDFFKLGLNGTYYENSGEYISF